MMLTYIAEYIMNECRITRREFDDGGLDYLVYDPNGGFIGVFDNAEDAENATH